MNELIYRLIRAAELCQNLECGNAYLEVTPQGLCVNFRYRGITGRITCDYLISWDDIAIASTDFDIIDHSIRRVHREFKENVRTLIMTERVGSS